MNVLFIYQKNERRIIEDLKKRKKRSNTLIVHLFF